MDPEANMIEQLSLARQIRNYCDLGDEDPSPADIETLTHKAARLAELVLALAEWNRKTRPVSAGL